MAERSALDHRPEKELLKISLIEVNLEAVEEIPPGQPVPVQINSVITEVGTLELWMKHTKSDRRWTMLRYFPRCFQAFCRVLGNSTQHARCMEGPTLSQIGMYPWQASLDFIEYKVTREQWEASVEQLYQRLERLRLCWEETRDPALLGEAMTWIMMKQVPMPPWLWETTINAIADRRPRQTVLDYNNRMLHRVRWHTVMDAHHCNGKSWEKAFEAASEYLGGVMGGGLARHDSRVLEECRTGIEEGEALSVRVVQSSALSRASAGLPSAPATPPLQEAAERDELTRLAPPRGSL